MRFHPGQTVVAIKSYSPWLTEGQHYVIHECYTCKCGQEYVDVGFKYDSDGLACSRCGMPPVEQSARWFHESRFAPLQEDEAELAVEKLLEEINQEQLCPHSES